MPASLQIDRSLRLYEHVKYSSRAQCQNAHGPLGVGKGVRVHINRKHKRQGHNADGQELLPRAKCLKSGCPGKGYDVSDVLKRHVALQLSLTLPKAQSWEVNEARPERGSFF